MYESFHLVCQVWSSLTRNIILPNGLNWKHCSRWSRRMSAHAVHVMCLIASWTRRFADRCLFKSAFDIEVNPFNFQIEYSVLKDK